MTVTCPTSPGYADFQPLKVMRSTLLESYSGADIQRINRLGDRFGAQVTLPIMPDEQAQRWVAWWNAAQSELAVIPWLVRNKQPRGYGAPLVNGANQVGRSLVVDGLPANARIDEGHVFSILSGTRRQLCEVTARATANGSGQATLAIWPALRFSPADNAVLEMSKPILQGFVVPEEAPFTPRMAGLAEFRFRMVEA